jgi:Competence protein
LGAAAFYLLLSGAELATQRSFIMAAIVLIGIMVDRPTLTFRTLTVAALVVLLLAPEAIVHPSFQASLNEYNRLLGNSRDFVTLWLRTLAGAFHGGALVLSSWPEIRTSGRPSRGPGHRCGGRPRGRLGQPELGSAVDPSHYVRMTEPPSRAPKGQTIYAKAHDIDGERRVDGLEFTLSPSAKGEQDLGEGTMDLPLALKARVVRKKSG